MTTTSRTKIESLILINWKGFFYQRFEMDEGVTALEGENGAGKTTVMIGAFVALLPDQRLLQFRSMSEPGGIEGDRGIFGRLGQKGIAYTILELCLPQKGKILAGVMLRKKAPPSLELTPFIAGGLSNSAALEEILLAREGEIERVPELMEIRQKLGQIGCTLEVYDSVAQYTSDLFTLGVTPLSMEGYAEREKFNRMLQTSMYGGLSSSIQKGLRDYLLAEDHSLRNHVARMRENLDACRVTRQEIDSAERKYKIIEGVFSAGYGMFESAFHGTRLRVVNLRRKADNSRQEHLRCKSELNLIERRLQELESAHAEAKGELEERQKESERAKDLLHDCREARKIAAQIERYAAEWLKARERLARSEELLHGAEKRRRDSVWLRDKLFSEKEEIASGLSNAQKAWEQVSRKVALLRQARQTLEDARKALPDREVEVRSAVELLSECRAEWDRALEEKTKLDLDLESFSKRIQSYREVLESLCRGLQREVSPEQALEAAKEFDRGFREWERFCEEAERLPGRIEEAGKTAGRQRAIREKIALLEKKGEKVTGAAALRSLFEMMQGEQDAHSEERSKLQERQSDLRQERARLQQQWESLKSEAGEWGKAGVLIRKLEESFEARIEDGLSFDELASGIEIELEKVRGRLKSILEERESLLEKAKDLEFGGGRLDEAMVRLRDLVDGRLAAELYDETPEKDAPVVEARLGPLHQALLVEDVAEAIEKISREPDFPDQVWLVEPGVLKEVPEGKPYPGAELVKMGDAWRLSRHPERPVVGRAAREREIED